MPTEMKVYDTYSSPYDTILLNWTPYVELRSLHLSFMESCKKILDHGAGTGNQTIELLKQGKDVTSIEIHDGMFGVLLEKCSRYPALQAIKMDVQGLALKDDIFDGVTSMNVIYNVPRPIESMKEAYRVLKKGGIFLMSGPLPSADIDYIAEHSLLPEFKAKGIYDDYKDLVDEVIASNRALTATATNYTIPELEEILFSQIGFVETLYATEEIYLGSAYFIAMRK